MSYYVDIIDQEKEESVFIIEKASRSSIILNWSGSDAKDDLSIVGSSLTFNFAHNEKVDAKFIDFFTGNEVRFKVELHSTTASTDELIWTGFVLPDTYSEPYTNGVTFVEFTASCGLGRLKGKYLPDDYYRDEKSTVDIICKILSLTTLELNIYFDPAIENSIQKDWDLIYLDTEYFFTDEKKEKKHDAYTILDKILQDTLCVCFQADNRWNIEGINKRHIRGYKAKLYDFNGDFLSEIVGDKLIKGITPLVTPTITMIPPYNLITVSHPRVPQSFPETIDQEKNEGWVVMTGVKGEVYATDWNGNNGYYAKAIVPNYYVALMKEYDNDFVPPPTVPFDENDFVNLKNKIFVYKYQKLVIKASFKILKYSEGLTPTDLNANRNPFYYEFLLNDTVLFSNKKTTIPDNENLIFEDTDGSLDFEVIMPEQGLIDVKFYRSGKSVYDTNIRGFEITELEISPVSFEETLIYTDVISNEYTIDKEIDLEYADDDTAFSKAFRLAKLKQATMSYNTIEIPIIYGFSQSGSFYSVVDLAGANLIKDNINTIVYNSEVLLNLKVIYNYNSSEQMVVKTDFVIVSGSFFVKVYKNNDYVNSRDSWLQWTDAIYKIETNRYAATVANVMRRMFNEPSEKLDVVALNAVKFNDLIKFHYVYDKLFVPTNCSWNVDQNKTTLTLSRAIYRDSGDSGTDPDNIPPIVNAGSDIELIDGQTTASLLAVAYDVDGFIASQKWTKTIGGFGDIILSPLELATDLQNLTEDLYEYEIKVADNDGATAVDRVRLTRRKDYEISLPFISKIPGDSLMRYISRWRFSCTPNIAPDFSLKIFGNYQLAVQGTAGEDHVSIVRIFKNGVKIFQDSLQFHEPIRFGDFSIGYISTDLIEFETEYQLLGTNPFLGWTWMEVSTVSFVNGFGDFTGLPIKVGDLSNGGL